MTTKIKIMIATLLRHALLLLVVVLLPVIVYDMQIPHLEFAGAATYPLYAAYLISKIKRRRPRFLLFHLLTLLAPVAVLLATNTDSIVLAALPTVIALLPLAAAMLYRRQGKREDAADCVFSSLIAIVPGLLLSGLAVLAIGMSGMPAMRY